MKLKVKLIADLSEQAMKLAQSMGIGWAQSPPTEPLNLLSDVFDVMARTIRPQPRTVHYSSRLRARQLPQQYRQALEAIEQKSAAGESLAAHQSRKILRGDEEDLLATSWNIHHLHLSSEPLHANSKFVARSNDLLFAYVTDQNLYFIDVLPHGGPFRSQDLLGAICSEWPSLVEAYRMPNLAPGECLSKKQREEARRFGLTVLETMPDGSVVVPPGDGCAPWEGSRRRGYSRSARLEAQRLLETTLFEQSVLEHNAERVAQALSSMWPPSFPQLTIRGRFNTGAFETQRVPYEWTRFVEEVEPIVAVECHSLHRNILFFLQETTHGPRVAQVDVELPKRYVDLS